MIKDFLKKRPVAIVISVIIVLLSIAVMIVHNDDSGALLTENKNLVEVIQEFTQESAPTSTNRNIRPVNPNITMERAVEIAHAELAKHGFTGTLRSVNMDWERGQWVWEVEIRNNNRNRNHQIVEIYINVDTGDVVKFEWD